jgi:hypothetical protein
MQIVVFMEKRSMFSMIPPGGVTATGWDPEVETKSLRIVSDALGYTIPQTGKTVLLIFHQSIFSPSLDHNLLCTMHMRLHGMVVNKTQNFQYQEPTDISHTINVRGEEVDDVLIILLDLDGVVSCLPTFKPSEEEFDTCDRYELTFEHPDYDPSAKTFKNKACQIHGED